MKLSLKFLIAIVAVCSLKLDLAKAQNDIGTALFTREIEIFPTDRDLTSENVALDAKRLDLMRMLRSSRGFPQSEFRATMIRFIYQVGKGHPSLNIRSSPNRASEVSTTVVPIENRGHSFGNLFKGDDIPQLDFVYLIDPRPNQILDLLVIGSSQVKIMSIKVSVLEMSRNEVDRAMFEYTRNAQADQNESIDLSQDQSKEPLFVAQGADLTSPPPLSTPREMDRPSTVVVVPTTPPQNSPPRAAPAPAPTAASISLRSCENRNVRVSVRAGQTVWLRDFDGRTIATPLLNLNAQRNVVFVRSKSYNSDSWVQSHRVCVSSTRLR